MPICPEDWTPEEIKAVESLQRLGNKWPDSLLLFSWSGSLVVVRKEDSTDDGIVDDRAVRIEGISNDGGDPNAVFL